MPYLRGVGEVHIGGHRDGQMFDVQLADLFSVSEANREGVEGEPQATLGGLLGSPRTGQWCRFCGSLANPSSDQCVPCWSAALSSVMEVSGVITADAADVLLELMTTDPLDAVVQAQLQPQLHDPATP